MPLHDLKFDCVAFLQGLEAFTLNGRVMDEHVSSAILANESVALAIVEPLYFPLKSCHFVLLDQLCACRTIERCKKKKPGNRATQPTSQSDSRLKHCANLPIRYKSAPKLVKRLFLLPVYHMAKRDSTQEPEEANQGFPVANPFGAKHSNEPPPRE